ncbi:glutamyl-tRNA reductase [Gallaecimonas kandeliae]|uniref:glutamyl-tRNA reductase n=1 Tax=Gallaecimonas kandeliae TaxID=3029055 RepID=UPI00264A2F23|nr:glutamyl-tRNA reductase [Gallaecimonas kandeliae]WKE64601.1 glutamyl-tRNA reductase [Gallaecimonas kandeliae]
MTLLAIGLNHKTAPVDLREKVAFGPDSLPRALAELPSVPGLSEAVVLSTCNRTEIYCQSEDAQAVERWLADFHQLEAEALGEHLYVYRGDQAIAHLLRVACGLDSMVLGEPQILGQLKQAYSQARQAGTVAQLLDKLFQHGFKVAKEVRTRTEIGASAVSVAYAAVSLAKHIFPALDDTKVLLIGAGETIELVATHLREQGVEQLMVANRTLARAESLASQFGAKAMTLEALPEHLHLADIVIGSTASPLPIIGKGMVERALKQRRHKPMFFVDLAVPRDIEGEVAGLRDAFLYTVDDLQQIIDENRARREAAAQEAETMVLEQVQAFAGWIKSLSAVDHIRDYRLQAEGIKGELLHKAQQQLQAGGDPAQILDRLASQLTNRLIHAPTKALSEAGAQGDLERLDAIAGVLGLDPRDKT